jgi:hypothetical protein
MDRFTLKNKIVSLIGKRNSGKSQMLRYLFSQQKHLFRAVFVVCPTETVNNFYKDLVKPQNIFDSYNEEWVEKLITKLAQENGGKPDNKASHILLILDDCCSDTNFHQSKSFKKLCTRGRHVKISVIITAQYIYQIPPVARNNSDFILCSQMNTQGLELLTSEFLFGNLTKKEFIDIYYKNTADYGFLVINNNCTKSNDDVNELYGNLKVPENLIKKM